MRKQTILGALAVLAMTLVTSFAPPAGPAIYVAPADTTVFLDQDPDTFVVRIGVTGEIVDLMGWDISVRFDSSIVTLDRVTEGALPRNSTNETFFWWFDAHAPATTVHVNGAILGNTVDGPGMLFDLVFVKADVGTTYVELFDTELRTGANSSIPHTTAQAYVVVEKAIAVEPTTWGQVKERYR